MFLFHSVLTEACHFLVEQEAPHQYYNSRQTLVASSDFEQTHGTGHENVNAQVSAMKEHCISPSAVIYSPSCRYKPV